MRTISVVLALVLVALFSGCTKEEPSRPPDGTRERLAGGGREEGNDPFRGGPPGSGPSLPGFAFPDPAYPPLFYADVDCGEEPSHRVIRDPEAWQEWWARANSCLQSDLGDEPPAVDFANDVVVAISLESAPTYGRGIWVQKVIPDDSGALIHYQVSHFDDDCVELLLPPGGPEAGSPTIAVLVPGPVADPVSWDREEVVFGCAWEPDPNLPVTLYYTDAPCDLGAGEVVIRDRERFDAWMDAALACDQARWYGPDSPTMPGWTDPGLPGGEEGDEDPPPSIPSLPPGWIGIGVDFTTHAVVVLRTDAQTRWGGGIWLDRIGVSDQGTTIEYTVMTPGGDCPPIGEDHALQPTAAIRVPLPLTGPITWVRHNETIPCAWEDETPGGGGVIPPPRPR